MGRAAALAFLIGALSSWTGQDAAARPKAAPSIKPGTPYARVHAQLMAAGYRPFRVLAPGSDAYRTHVFNREDVYRLYPDVEACAGTGTADCNFVLTRGPGDNIAVHTVGEEAQSIVVTSVQRITASQADAFYR